MKEKDIRKVLQNVQTIGVQNFISVALHVGIRK
jgi:hypothetical protein